MSNRFFQNIAAKLETKSESSSTICEIQINKYNKNMNRKEKIELFLRVAEIASLFATIIGWFI